MKRLAVFVEGQTEQLFAESLIREMAGQANIRFELRSIRGGAKARRETRLLRSIPADAGQEYYVLIVDCGGDETVVSRIREEYDNLVARGYEAIVGIRDVYPLPREDIPNLARRIPLHVKTKPIRVVFVLAIMEVEAWFLAEYTHFERIDPALTVARISAHLDFDPSAGDMEQRPTPAGDLHAAYQLAGLAYSKSRARVQRTVGHLDYARLYLDIPARYPSLESLVSALDRFFSA
jgi:hypothetical protein